VHTILGTALAGGDTVWTVNVDELIEAASSTAARVATYPDPAPEPTANLLKPHGSTSRGEYVFRSDQVVRPLPGPWQRRLLAACDNAHVVAIGYRAMDIDMRATLDEALAAAASITWFEAASECDALRERLPALRHPHAALHGTAPSSLSSEFVAWADAAGLTRNVTPAQRAAVARQSHRAIAALHGDPALARAMLLERIGNRLGARRELIRLILRPPIARAKRAAVGLRTIDLYGGASWTRPLMRWAAGPLQGHCPRACAQRLDRVHVTILSSHLGQHERAMRRASVAADQNDPAILLAEAKAARFAGDLTIAIRKAKEAEAAARDADGAIDELAHALFEQAFAYTWVGRYDEARQSLKELFSGVDGLAGIRWVAWAYWHHACLAIYANDQRTALLDLDRSYALFLSDQLPAGQVAALTVRLTAARLGGDDDLFRNTLSAVQAMRGTRGWTNYTDASINQERVEWHRRNKDLAAAARLNELVVAASSDEPVHLGMGLITRAELERARGEDNIATADNVRDLLRRHPMAYISAHLAITDFLAGRDDAQRTLAAVAAAAPDLTTRSGRPPSDPLDFCLGLDPHYHELFLP
jgi:hypothetical protein